MAILIVDDSSIVRTLVRKALEMHNYKDIIEAENGKIALEKAKKLKGNIQLYIFDINMPEMDGLTLVKEIRNFDPLTPIIMLTTETDKNKIIKARDYGATGWITKPFQTDKFIKVVKLLIK
jgi:two-component system chemotaxis response regulator CheY